MFINHLVNTVTPDAGWNITMVMSTLEILSCTLGFHSPFVNCLQVLGIHSLPLFFLTTEAALLVPCSVSLFWQLGDQMCRVLGAQDDICSKDV